MNDFEIKNGYCKILSLSSKLSDSNENFDTIKNAVRICKKYKLLGIELPNGEFPVFNNKAKKLFKKLLSAEMPALDYAYWRKYQNVLFNVDDLESFSILGDNTLLLADGLMGVFDFANIRTVKLQGITVDWLNPLYFVGEITDISDKRITVKTDAQLQGNEPIVSFQNIDIKTNRQKGMSVFCNISSVKKEANGQVSFTSEDTLGLSIGDGIIARYIYNYSPVMQFYSCRDVFIEDVTLNAGAGMGVVAHKCKNLSFKRYRDILSKDRVMSTNTDATHLISCYGKVHFLDCEFEGMGDDAVNIHGFYLTVKEIMSQNSVLAYFESNCQSKYYDVPDCLDSIEFIDRNNLVPFANGEIIKVIEKADGIFEIIFKDKLPEGLKTRMLLANTTKTAQLLFENCTVKNIRGRALLIQTRNAIIRNNIFEGCTGQGVHIDTADGWMESIGTRNITIENNKFIDCGYGITKYCDAVGVVVETEASEYAIGVHKNIIIRNNYIKGKNTGIKLLCAENVILSGNKFDGCSKEYDIEFCKNVIKNF